MTDRPDTPGFDDIALPAGDAHTVIENLVAFYGIVVRGLRQRLAAANGMVEMQGSQLKSLRDIIDTGKADNERLKKELNDAREKLHEAEKKNVQQPKVFPADMQVD